MKNGVDPGHFLSGGSIELTSLAVRDSGADGDSIEHPGKMEVGGYWAVPVTLRGPSTRGVVEADGEAGDC